MTSLPTADRTPPGAPRRWSALLVALGFVLAALLPVGCGDDDDDDNDGSNSETLNTELQGLGDFAQDVTTSTPAQVVSSPQVSSLLDQIGLSLGFNRSKGMVPIDFDRLTKPETAIHSSLALATKGSIFGTYTRDVTSKVAPFPGWVFVSSDPTDGFVFQFDEKDDIVVYDGSQEIHLAGEIRFLNVAYQVVGVENVLTNVLMELVIDPIKVPVIHIPFTGVLPKGGSSTDYTRAELGDISQPNNLTNCYFGTLAFDFLHDAASLTDVQTTLLAVDTTQDPDYVLLLDLDQLNVGKGEIPEEIDVRFGFGHSDDASDPAVDVIAELTDIVIDPKTEDVSASVTGNINHLDHTLATFAGSTDLVQLDVDITGDGKVTAEDVCVDIDITFTDNNQTQNICVALQGLQSALPFLPEGAGNSLRFGPLAF